MMGGRDIYQRGRGMPRAVWYARLDIRYILIIAPDQIDHDLRGLGSVVGQ